MHALLPSPDFASTTFRVGRAGLWLVLAFGFCAKGDARAQVGPSHYVVALSDKTWGATYPYTLEAPEAYLSTRALARRARQGISVDSLDLPVSEEVLNALDALEDWQVLHASRWMSSVVVEARDSLADTTALTSLPFVEGLKSLPRGRRQLPDVPSLGRPKNTVAPQVYGQGWLPLTQLHAEPLHALGFQGQGMWIAVLDAGFQNLMSLDAFATLRDEGRLVVNSGANIAFGGDHVFGHSRHGTSVLGTMAACWTDSLIGTAPKATYFPYVTEDVTREVRLEEEHWIVAAEHADALGVDLINTSLGYSLFDDSTQHHLVSDLDGRTARISVASEHAASRGMLVVTSAGNNGDDPWHFITFPADAHGILAVGAVNADGERGWFSGYGPASDGRVKPDVMAHGVAAAYPRHDGTVATGNGTSFASPILCGAAACLWQAHPEATAAQIREAIVQSAHLYTSPTAGMGHGIPDFGLAHTLLGGTLGATNAGAQGAHLRLFPNPLSASGEGTLRWTLEGLDTDAWAVGTSLMWRITNASGQVVTEGQTAAWNVPLPAGHLTLDAGRLRPGTYHVQLCAESGTPCLQAPLVVLP